MSNSQIGIFDKRYRDHLFLEYRRVPGQQPDAVRRVVRQLQSLRRSRVGQAFIVLGFGADLWAGLGGEPAFAALDIGPELPSTPEDLWVWVQATDRSVAFDLGRQVDRIVGGVLTLARDVDGFVYHDSRDLSGFVDGIGNPEGDKALAAALVPEGQPGAGGSHLLTQVWRHRLDALEQLSVPQQEKVFGRTKMDAIEFEGDDQPADSHVGRTDAEHDGVPQKMWRRSVPWGRVSEHGLYFVAFCCDPARFDFLLRRMYGMEDGVRDRLLEFTAPVTGAYWFVPSEDALQAL